MTLSNSVFEDYGTDVYFYFVAFCQQIVVRNLTLQNVSRHYYQSMSFAGVSDIQIYDLKIVNYTGSYSEALPILTPNVVPGYQFILNGLYIENTDLTSTGFFRNQASFESCVFSNVHFKDVIVDSSVSTFQISNVKNVQLQNLIFDTVYTPEGEAVNSALFNVLSIDFDSNYDTFEFKVSEIKLIEYRTFLRENLLFHYSR